MPSYNPKAIEPRWQRHWQENKTFRTPDESDRPKFYVLDMFPYPSGSGLHVGHPEGYTATDILARYRRMRGFNVLHPMGWDAFGLPAEQHAIKTGEHPHANTQRNVNTFRRQIQSLGFSYDWDREVDTTDPNYFKWTQWIFLVLFDTWYDAERKKGRPISELPIPAEVKATGDDAVRAYRDGKRLAYQAEGPVNWCAGLGTVLSNEDVIDGKSEVGGFPVVRMPLRQWLLRITAYADRLIDDLEPLDWSESIKKMQRDWIGRSEGAEVDFALALPSPTGGRGVGGEREQIRVFTTRPDTLFGATYVVLAPEHALVAKITTPAQAAAVKAYQEATARKSDFERTEVAKKKTGVFTGAYAINPVNNASIPVWIADYVLATYGTGAIMAVPAHDVRDWEFARTFSLPIPPVVQPPEGYQPSKEEAAVAHEEGGRKVFPFVGEGVAINSGEFTGLPSAEFKKKIIAWLVAKGLGTGKVNYKLRDWLFSRQRYWGEPFPVLHELDEQGKPTGKIEALSVEELPLRLPEVSDYKPTGSPEPPLEKAKDWLYVTRNGKRYKRETNTMPQWAGSCWYYLRFIDPRNDKAFCDPEKAKRWLPVDLYVGGAEHAVLHLLYSRFWHKVLHDRGHVPTPEPFQKLVNQGLILGETEYTGFTRTSPEWVSVDAVNAESGREKGSGAKVFAVRVPDQLVDTKANPPVLKQDAQVRVIADEDNRYVGYQRVTDWVSATAEMDPESGKNKRTDEAFQTVHLDDQEVEKDGDSFVLKVDKTRVDARAFKMSKSRGNVVNPDRIIDRYGADSLRLYEMFMGPLEASKPWSTRSVDGVYRFLGRVWRLIIDDRAEAVKLNETVQDAPADKQTLRELHRAIQRVTEGLDDMRFNTAIAAMMELSNYLTPLTVRPRSVLETFVLILAPFAPHVAEELWHALGHQQTLAYEPWPAYDPEMLKEDSVEVPVQVNGKLKAKVVVPSGLDAKGLEAAVMADPTVQSLLQGKTIKKVIVPPRGGLVNVVVA